MQSDTQNLEAEARLFARYLLDRDAPSEMIERYVGAHASIGLGAADPLDKRILDFMRKQPWSIGLLDATLALLSPASLARRKILLMAAILEASPRFAGEFLPVAVPVPSLVLKLAWIGISSGFKFALGIPLFLFLRATS